MENFTEEELENIDLDDELYEECDEEENLKSSHYTEYKRLISSNKTFTDEEEKYYFNKYKTDKSVLDTIVNANLKLVLYFVDRCYSTERESYMMDLVQAGNLGLLKAIEKFDLSKGFKFATYASPWIRSFIQKEIVEHISPIILTKYAYGKYKEGLQKHDNIFERTTTELEKLFACREDKTYHIMKEVYDAKYPLSYESTFIGSKDLDLIYEPDKDDDIEYEQGLISNLVEDKSINIEEQAIHNLNIEGIDKLLDMILVKKNQKEVIERRYGVLDNDCYNLREIGEQLGISHQRVDQIERESRRKLERYEKQLRKYI